jgi:hypothetical protein
VHASKAAEIHSTPACNVLVQRSKLHYPYIAKGPLGLERAAPMKRSGRILWEFAECATWGSDHQSCESSRMNAPCTGCACLTEWQGPHKACMPSFACRGRVRLLACLLALHARCCTHFTRLHSNTQPCIAGGGKLASLQRWYRCCQLPHPEAITCIRTNSVTARVHCAWPKRQLKLQQPSLA